MAKANLLIVDDDAFFRKLISRNLTKQDYQVEGAGDGREALEKYRTGDFDMVLLDIQMPELDGFAVLQELRQTHSLDQLPVIMVTGDEDEENMVKALEMGANDYITKSVDLKVAQARITTHLTLKKLAETYKEFLGIASHDLKKPLLLIQDVLEALKEDYPLAARVEEDMHDMLDLSLKTTTNMQRIVQDFLDMSALDSGRLRLERKPLNLNALAQQVVDSNANYAQRMEQTVHLKLDPAVSSMLGDELRLYQVMENLVGNAIKFSPLRASTLVRTRAEQDTVLFEVQDSGPGLSEEDQKKAFVTRFATLSNAPTGNESSTGLGLSICKQIIDVHGGQIGVRNNTPAPGATFWFSLPKTPS